MKTVSQVYKLFFVMLVLVSVSSQSCKNDYESVSESVVEKCAECESADKFNPSVKLSLGSNTDLKESLMDFLDNYGIKKSTYSLEKGQVILDPEKKSLSVIWLPLKQSSSQLQEALYFYVFEGEIQVGFKYSLSTRANGLKLAKHFNLVGDELFELQEQRDKSVVFTKITKDPSLLTATPSNLQKRTNAKISGCSWTTNFNTCANDIIVEISSNPGLALLCMAFGPECAATIAGTCAGVASIATANGECLKGKANTQ
jgi:hypothetical protein